ncbi:MAG: BatA domain-containing protein, partial [Rhodopirellula sp. JB053]
MSFLGGWFLLGLPLLAIPIVIHMMKKRQRDVIAWGAMQFLRDPTRRGQRISQTDRWLLLAARVLILGCLIGALSQPLFHATRSSGVAGLPMQVILIDDTRSTLADGRFDQIRRTADQLMGSFPTDTPIEIWAVGNPPRRIIDEVTDNRSDATNITLSQIRSSLSDYRPRGGSGNFTDAVHRVVVASVEADKSRRELHNEDFAVDTPMDVWLITDDTAAGWNPPLSASAMLPDPNHRLHIIQACKPIPPLHQWCVTSVESSRRTITTNDTIEVSATIANLGTRPSPKVTGVWKQNGRPVAETPVKTLQPDEQLSLQTETTVLSAGTHEFTFELKPGGGAASDSMPDDDSGHVVINAVGEMPLLVIRGPRGPFNQSPSAADFLAAALGRNSGAWASAANDMASDGDANNRRNESLFHPEVYSAAELDDLDWRRYPAIVWLGGVELPSKVLNRLINRVRQGAGLWITLDSKTDRESMNDVLHKRVFNIPTEDRSNSDDGTNGIIGELVVNYSHDQLQRLHPPEPTDPILSPLSDTERLDLDLVRIRRRIDLHPPRGHASSRVLLRTFEGNPVAILSGLGRGRVVLQALPMDPSWSNFALSKSFVVWVLQVLDHLSQPVGENYNLASGQMFRKNVKEIDHEYELTTPTGQTEVLIALPQLGQSLTQSHADQSAGVVRFDRTDQPGLYRLQDSDEDTESIVFSVAGDPSESALFVDSAVTLTRLADTPRVNLYRQSTGIDLQSIITSIPEDQSRGRSGTPLWPALLIGLMIAISLETFLAGYAALRRYGRLRNRDVDPIAMGTHRSDLHS